MRHTAQVHHAFTAYENTVELKPARQPLGLLFQLYPHQKLGLDFLEKSEKFPKYRGSILADDMVRRLMLRFWVGSLTRSAGPW